MQSLPNGLTALQPDGTAVPLRFLAAEGPVLIAFLRHFG